MEVGRRRSPSSVCFLLAGLLFHSFVTLGLCGRSLEGFADQRCHKKPGCSCPPTSPPHGGGGGYKTPPSHGGGGYYSSPPPIINPPSPTYEPVTPTPYVPPTPTTPTIITPPAPPLIPDPNTPPFTTGTCNYWLTHSTVIWGIFGYWGTVGQFFGLPATTVFGANLSLQQALANTRTDGIGALFREGTASFLNSMVNKKFPFTPHQVKDAFTAAVVSNKAAAAQAELFKQANEGHLKH